MARTFHNFRVPCLLNEPKRAHLLSMPTEITNMIMEHVFRDCYVSLKLPLSVHGRASVTSHNIPFSVLLSSRKLRTAGLSYLQGIHVRIEDIDASLQSGPNKQWVGTAVTAEELDLVLPRALREITGSLAISNRHTPSNLLRIFPKLENLIVTGGVLALRYSQPLRDLNQLSEQPLMMWLAAILDRPAFRRILRIRTDDRRSTPSATTGAALSLQLSFEFFVVQVDPPRSHAASASLPRLRIKYDHDRAKLSVFDATGADASIRLDLTSRSRWSNF